MSNPGEQPGTVSVVFVQSDGRQETYIGNIGETVMDVALDHGVQGIIAQCGGGCTCCTCHCYVQTPWKDQLDAPHADELDMLVYAWSPKANSRLACQITLRSHLDGMVIVVPAQQA